LDFPLSEVDPAAINKIVSGVKEKSGVNDLNVTVMTLAKSPVDGLLKWVINAEGGGRTGLVYNAEPDGSNVASPLGDIAGSGSGGASTSGGPSQGATTSARRLSGGRHDPERQNTRRDRPVRPGRRHGHQQDPGLRAVTVLRHFLGD